jgi:hypothetical protein
LLDSDHRISNTGEGKTTLGIYVFHNFAKIGCKGVFRKISPNNILPFLMSKCQTELLLLLLPPLPPLSLRQNTTLSFQVETH